MLKKRRMVRPAGDSSEEEKKSRPPHAETALVEEPARPVCKLEDVALTFCGKKYGQQIRVPRAGGNLSRSEGLVLPLMVGVVQQAAESGLLKSLVESYPSKESARL